MRVLTLCLATVALAACRMSDAGNAADANAATAENGAAAATLSLARLDCGKIEVKDFAKDYSDTPGLYPAGPRTMTDSCYLIRHGDQLMLWDAGFNDSMVGRPFVDADQMASLDRSLIDQLKAGNVTPEQISFVGISHYHADHTGQAGRFPGATLLIGQADFEALKGKATGAFFKMAQDDLKHWLTGGGKVDPVTGDRDVFGDGSVVMLGLPGHTPGHHSLLVNLKSGPVLLSGDLYHADIAREKRGVPPFNTDRAATLKSIDAFEAKAKALNAKVIVQHEAADIDKLPAYPKAAQ